MTAVEHDWRRTHAVIVAVERYNGGDELNLDGPVHDAIGMRTWLTGRGVPPENIQLLASPMERNRAALEAAHPGYRPAERADVRKVFREGLREIDGDWLWIYWAGHGVQAPGGRWSLLYPETSNTDLLGLDADSLVDLMRTEHLPWDGMDRVTVIIDACRQALPTGTHELVDDPDLLTKSAQIRPERPVYWMRACQAGAVAKERQGAGRFTSVLLRQLHAAGTGGTALDLGRVWEGVRGEFDRLRAEEDIDQYPTVFVSDWSGNENKYSWPPPLDEEQRQTRQRLVLETASHLEARPGRAAGVAARLCEEFTTAPPAAVPPTADDLVDWALAHPHGLVTLLAVLAEQAPGRPIRPASYEACHVLQSQWLTSGEYRTLVTLLGRLDARGRYGVAETARELFTAADVPSTEPVALADSLEALLPTPHRLPQLLRVVEHFAALDGGAVAGELRDWSLACARRLGLEPALRDRRAEAQEHAARVRVAAADRRIQIRLHAPSGPGQRRAYEVWSRSGEEVGALAKVDSPASLEEIQARIDALLAAHGRVSETLVEFFVPSTDLELGVHRWPLDASRPQERALGTDFPVVLRCVELRQSQRRHLWERRWKQVATATTGDLQWLPAEVTGFKQVRAAIERQETAPGAVVAAPRAAREAVFTACLFDGLPVLVWDSDAEPALTDEKLKELLGITEPSEPQLESLPRRLRKLRLESDGNESHPGRHLALLWDDPHRPLPGQLDLSAP
ncbi:caspase family protein [Streptomyces sp. NPDC007983]|uniref:VMAP-C domain-containing protein n=1 Tax=Streptomyces sp. NPDC007983 TaxID=3364800 RepID=UPI0036EBD247